jgi:hypothetical protein
MHDLLVVGPAATLAADVEQSTPVFRAPPPVGDVPWMPFAGSLPGMWPEGHLDALHDEWDPANPIADSTSQRETTLVVDASPL